MIASELQGLTFNYLLQTALDQANNIVDKRQGSIIYDSLASICYLISNEVIDALLKSYIDNYVGMASGESLDRLVEMFGLTRIEATYAQCKVEFYDSDNNLKDVPIGTMFTTLNTPSPVTFITTEEYIENATHITGTYLADCQTAGTIGNMYIGECSLSSNIQGISRVVLTEITVYARDVETDDELRERVKDKVKYKSWAGNIQSYKDWITNGTLNNVGQMQVYPVWNGHGTVKLSLVDTNNRPLDEQTLTEILDLVAPLVNGTRTEGHGYDPIDCLLTLDTPSYYNIDVDMTIVKEAGYDDITVKNNIISMLNNYAAELNGLWGDGSDPYQTIMQIAVIGARAISIDGVADVDVSSILLNGANTNLTLNHTSANQYLCNIDNVNITIS